MSKAKLLLSALVVISAIGCGSDSPQASKAEDKALRDNVMNPPPLDINKVQPEFREKVLQMRGGAAAATYGKSSGTPAAPPQGGAPAPSGGN